MNRFCDYLPMIIALARQAGAQIMEIYESDFAITEKQDKSPLTAADMAAHKTIIAGLAEHTPDIPALSEESAQIPFATRSQWQQYWLIDPLDGTREFINRNGEFTVNIALIDHNYPVLGVVYVPAKGIIYAANHCQGAQKIVIGEQPQRLNVNHASNDELTVVGSRSHRGASLDEFLLNVGKHRMVSMGSSLKLCLVAEGVADIYPRLGPTSEWDTAAAQCVVEAAGGYVTDTQMQRLSYNQKESLLNPHFLVFGKQRDWSQYLPAA